MTELLPALMEDGRPYPASAQELRELLAGEDQAMVNTGVEAE